MDRKKIFKLVFRISDGVFSALIDLILWNIFFLAESTFIGSPGKVHRLESLVRKDLEKFNSQTIKRAIAKARSKGFIKNDLTLTKEGKERLGSFFPKYFGSRKWNGNWYLVIYDIPERKRRSRTILRELLEKLGFGQLQKSVYISPFNFLGEIEKIIKDYKLSPYVILAITNKLGTEEAKTLANRVWRLDRINEEYKKLLSQVKKSNKKNLYFKYLNILREDSQLPKELLPNDWAGIKVHQLFKKFRVI